MVQFRCSDEEFSFVIRGINQEGVRVGYDESDLLNSKVVVFTSKEDYSKTVVPRGCKKILISSEEPSDKELGDGIYFNNTDTRGIIGYINTELARLKDKFLDVGLKSEREGEYYTVVNGRVQMKEYEVVNADGERRKVPGLVNRHIVGVSEGVIEVLKKLQNFIHKSDKDILVLGEYGTGKGVVARVILENIDGVKTKSGYDEEKAEVYNSASFSDSLLSSEFEGYKANAFTGADTKDRGGILKSKNGGVVVFDEVAELSHQMQAKLLHIINDRRIRPVGDTKTHKINVRFVFMTNKPLSILREDFRSRIETLVVVLPPLRERKGDIEYIARNYIEMYNERYPFFKKVLDDSAIETLKVFDWPGNIRELEKTLDRALVMSEDSVIRTADIIRSIKMSDYVPSQAVTQNIERLKEVKIG